MKKIKLYQTLFLLLSIVMISCGETEKKKRILASDKGVTWILENGDKDGRPTYTYGFTLYSSGIGFRIFFDKRNKEETPILGCNDCGGPSRLKDALFNWSLNKDSLIFTKDIFISESYKVVMITDSFLELQNKGKFNDVYSKIQY